MPSSVVAPASASAGAGSPTSPSTRCAHTVGRERRRLGVAAERVAQEVDRRDALFERDERGPLAVRAEADLRHAGEQVRERALLARREVLLPEVVDPVPVGDEEEPVGVAAERGALLVPIGVERQPVEPARRVEVEAVEVELGVVVVEHREVVRRPAAGLDVVAAVGVEDEGAAVGAPRGLVVGEEVGRVVHRLARGEVEHVEVGLRAVRPLEGDPARRPGSTSR